MSEPSRQTRVNWRQAAGEALLIFMGVAVALVGQAWWEYRSDRELELFLVSEIREGLGRDSADIASAMGAAEARIVGADRLLEAIEDPYAGAFHPTPWEANRSGQVPLRTDVTLQNALAAYHGQSFSPQQALHMVVAASSMQRLDLSDATFNDAAASGQLNVIRDPALRAGIAEYYFNTGRFGNTTDDRVETHWRHFRELLSEKGLSSGGGETDGNVLTALARYSDLLAELKNVRDYAAYQSAALATVLQAAESVITMLDVARAEF